MYKNEGKWWHTNIFVTKNEKNKNIDNNNNNIDIRFY